jgi:hypothetical protein
MPAYKKSKAIPVTGCGGLQGCEMLRIPHCLDNRLEDGGNVLNTQTKKKINKFFTTVETSNLTQIQYQLFLTEVQKSFDQNLF